MKRILLLCLLLVLSQVLTGCMRTTGKTEVGVRTVTFSLFGEAGVENKVYEPGASFFFLPFVNDWNTFDIKLQNLEMTAKLGQGDRASQDDLSFKTIDGSDIDLDVIIAYRIDPKKAYYILEHVAKTDKELREKVVRTISRSTPRDLFGELKTEEFYVAAEREKKAEEVRLRLSEILEPYGVIVEKVLTKDYRFKKEYQDAIRDKKIADQEAEVYKSTRQSVEEEYRTKLKKAEGSKKKMIAEVNGRFRQAKLEADAYLNRQKRIANVITIEYAAEAKSQKKTREAFAAEGSDTYVRLQTAKALQGKRIVLLPVSDGGMNLKTTNINQLLGTLGVVHAAEMTEEKPAKSSTTKN